MARSRLIYSGRQVEPYVKDVDYPASKEEVIRIARENGAPDFIISSMVEVLPDTVYGSPVDVGKVIDESANS